VQDAQRGYHLRDSMQESPTFGPNRRTISLVDVTDRGTINRMAAAPTWRYLLANTSLKALVRSNSRSKVT
jgi:hypothetical protein